MSAAKRCVLLPLAVIFALAPVRGSADRDTLTLEVGGSVVATRLGPSIGSGDAIAGTLGGAEVRVRYALSHRVEVQAGGFWNRTATFVSTQVTTTTGAGVVTGDLRRDVGRIGAAVGARYVFSNRLLRLPVGLDLGWLRTTFANQDLVDRSDPRAPTSFGLRIESTTSNRPFLAPFVGLEWLATDRLSFSIVPRLELPLGGSSTPAIAVPLSVGWSWFLL